MFQSAYCTQIASSFNFLHLHNPNPITTLLLSVDTIYYIVSCCFICRKGGKSLRHRVTRIYYCPPHTSGLLFYVNILCNVKDWNLISWLGFQTLIILGPLRMTFDGLELTWTKCIIFNFLSDEWILCRVTFCTFSIDKVKHSRIIDRPSI